jgi:hypothetical protein
MTPECHRLAARLERARLMKRWSEVLVVAEQLQMMNATPGDGSCAQGDVGNCEAQGFTWQRQSGATDPPPATPCKGGGLLSGSSQANGFDLYERPVVLPMQPRDRAAGVAGKNACPTRAANWLQKWWSLAFPAGDAMKAQAMTQANATMRFLLWVDAVGGYLVSTGDEVVIGQPAPGHEVDIPIRGDLSRRHAVFHRDAEGYLLEPVRDVKINGTKQERTVSLHDGDLLTLGESVQLRFRRPHPLSQTARLEFLSYHRTQPATDGVLLMAESCILGPGAASHVVCPGWPHDVVVYRNREALGCRSPKPFKIDGVEHQGRANLAERSRVAGEGFSFSVEAE